jgi:hypothetical protein
MVNTAVQECSLLDEGEYEGESQITRIILLKGGTLRM